jgi:ADP-ribosyl-[dinitrogen reductase] hydrolase
MPVHWYYDRKALAADYGVVTDYLAPRNPHPDSEMGTYRYAPTGPKDDILHDQAPYWGKAGIHYHQFLEPGENTLTLQLCNLLIGSLEKRRIYDPEDYLDRLTDFMLTPNRHRDTYINEYLREFFKRYGAGIPLRDCGIPERHLSGLIGIVPIAAFYRDDPETALAAASEHVSLTHKGPLMAAAVEFFVRLLFSLFSGKAPRAAVNELRDGHTYPFLSHDFAGLAGIEDAEAMDGPLGAGCYIEESLPLVIHLLLKYGKDPEKALVVNTNLGANNAERGAVLGALLGALNGVDAFPDRWIDGLRRPPPSELCRR